MLVMTKSSAFDGGFGRRFAGDAHAGRHLRRETGDDAQAILIDVVERDVGDAAGRSATGRRPAAARGRRRRR